MSSLSHSENRSLYSWWWDSHISPKNSKWLQENLSDMDYIVKAMIRLIEEDADSFARRAEMYYKKRPELMKLVEEFYRAYRALAERYDHATLELRHAHRTMAEAFPNQLPSIFEVSSPNKFLDPSDTEPNTPEMPHPIRALLDPDYLDIDDTPSTKHHSAKMNVSFSDESESEISKMGLKQFDEMMPNSSVGARFQHPLSGESVETLNEDHTEIKSEKNITFLQYQQTLARLADLDRALTHLQNHVREVDEWASKSEAEVKSLTESLLKLEFERDDGIIQHKTLLEKVSYRETVMSQANSEPKIRDLKLEISKLEAEKMALEGEISRAQDESRKLKGEILLRIEKIKSVEEHNVELQKLNCSLLLEVDSVAQNMVMKNQELVEKDKELERLQICVQKEHSHFLQIEAGLQTLQNLHTQSQEEYIALSLEVKETFQMLKDSEKYKQDLEGEILHINKENQILNDLTHSSAISMKNMQEETSNLRCMKGKLEDEVSEQMDQINAFQRDICLMKGEIENANQKYRALVEQLDSVGLDPKCITSSVKALSNENSNLKVLCEKNKGRTEALLKKLEHMKTLLENNAVLEGSLSETTDKVKSLQASHQKFFSENSKLAAEKSSLFSQVQTLNENMQKLLEKNIFLEDSFLAANIQTEKLRVESKSLQELYSLLKSEKFSLLMEKETLVSQLEGVEYRLEIFVEKYRELEERYDSLEKENEHVVHHVTELRASLCIEKEEHSIFKISSEARLVGLEDHINILQEKSRQRRIEFESELDKAVNTHLEIFIMQRCMQDMEANNLCLLNDCQRHSVTSKFSKRLILELKCENLDLRVERDALFDEVEKLKEQMYEIFKVLQSESTSAHENEIMLQIIRNIEYMKSSLLRIEDEKQQLMVGNSVIFALICGLRLEGVEFALEKKLMDHELKAMLKKFESLQSAKHVLEESNRLLLLGVSETRHREKILKAEMDCLHQKLVDLQGEYQKLQSENTILVEENTWISKENLKLNAEKYSLEVENNNLFVEAIYFDVLCAIYQCFGTDKVMELKDISKDLKNALKINSDVQKDVEILVKTLEGKETENLHLNSSVEKLDKELHVTKALNDQLDHQILVGKDLMSHKEVEITEALEDLKYENNLNTELCKTIDRLDRECVDLKLGIGKLENLISELLMHRSNQTIAMDCLIKVNGKLESDIDVLYKEIEECGIRELYLNSEFREKSAESEIWEAEATTFYFDLHVTSVREVMFEKKVHELASVCESLQGDCDSKIEEIESEKERVNFLESEIRGIKSQLSAYNPVVRSLANDILSLERITIFRSMLSTFDNQEQKDVEVVSDSPEECSGDYKYQTTEVTDSFSNLQKMQLRIKAVEKSVEEMERLARQESSNANAKLESAMKEIEDLKSNILLHQQKTEPARTGILMKDIPLDQSSNCSIDGISRVRTVGSDDQMLELWETAEHETKTQISEYNTFQHRFENDEEENGNTFLESHVNKEAGIDKLHQNADKLKIIGRIASDAHKLNNLRITVQHLKENVETEKDKNGNKEVEYATIYEQLQVTDETILQLIDVNAKLMENIEEIPSSLASCKSEQARNEYEKIGRLQLEVQKIQYILLKLEDEGKSKGKNLLPVIRPRILLRDFIYCGDGKKSKRKRKGGFCACLRPSINEN